MKVSSSTSEAMVFNQKDKGLQIIVSNFMREEEKERLFINPYDRLFSSQDGDNDNVIM